jgi:hypothetical protein
MKRVEDDLKRVKAITEKLQAQTKDLELNRADFNARMEYLLKRAKGLE